MIMRNVLSGSRSSALLGLLHGRKKLVCLFVYLFLIAISVALLCFGWVALLFVCDTV
jgi:hypothetical protein